MGGGFTIVELLIVIVVIATLAAITVVAYTGIQTQARNSKILSDINQVNKLVQLHYAEHGEYPQTGSAMDSANLGRVDSNCPYGSNKFTDWVPDLANSLPQSDGNPQRGAAVEGTGRLFGCYMYFSDGVTYVLTAWNMLNQPQTSTLYRRLGSREASPSAFFCNHTNIGGNRSNTYDINEDFYKFSYTISNVTSCNETPPAGA